MTNASSLGLSKVNLWLFLCLILGSTILTAQENRLDMSGTLGNDTPFLEFPLITEEPNSTILVDMQATSGDLDTLLYLVDGKGNIVAENDDRAKGNTDSLLQFPQAAVGSYTVIATRYDVVGGKTVGDFELVITINPTRTETTEYAVSDADLLADGIPAIDACEEAEWTILACSV